jgi:hypothetical protein
MENQFNEEPSYYAIIPANVRYDKNLTANAKLLFGEITALCNKKGFCWANNNYFAELYGVSKTSISKWLSQLEQIGYVKTSIKYKEGTKQILNRYITIINEPIEEKLNTPIEEKLKDNNTSTNNTFNNKNELFINEQIPLKISFEKKEKPTKESFNCEVWPSFDDWWQLYDKKTGKPKCEAKFKKLPQATKEKIMQHTEVYVLSQQDKQFRKNPLTYLNNESWNDEIIQKSNKDEKQQALNQLGSFTLNYKRERDNVKNNNG